MDAGCDQKGPQNDPEGKKWNKQNDPERAVAFLDQYTAELKRTRQERDTARDKCEAARFECEQWKLRARKAEGELTVSLIHAPKTFDFSEALKRMKAGKCVNRANYGNEFFLPHTSNRVHTRKPGTPDAILVTLTADEMLATDWYEVPG